MRILLLVAVSLVSSAAFSQTSSPTTAAPLRTDRLPWSKFVPSMARDVIPAFAAELEEKYVFPATGKRYAAALRANLAAGRYENFRDVAEFAEKVTADLQSISRDGHLLLIAPRPQLALNSPGQSPQRSPEHHGIVRSGWIAPDVAYIDFADFPGDKATLSKLQEFIAKHAGAKTLIIDARRHHGGWILEADMLFRELFRRPTDLATIDMRKSVAEKIGGLGGPGIRTVAGPPTIVRYVNFVKPSSHPVLSKTTVYLLISHATISAGEHFAFVLKSRRRATLIGEATFGAGHVESDFPLPDGFSGRVPFARAYDPRTNKGWEGTGVQPDVRVPSDRALGKALRLAGVKIAAETALTRLH